MFHSADATPKSGSGGDPEESARVAVRRARTRRAEVLRRQSLEPPGDADLSTRFLRRPERRAPSPGRGLLPIPPPRAWRGGIPVPVDRGVAQDRPAVCTPTSRWAATCPEQRLRERGRTASCTSSCSVICLMDPRRSIRRGWPHGTCRSTLANHSRNRDKGCIGTRSPKGSRRAAKAYAGETVRKCSRGRSSGWVAPPTSFNHQPSGATIEGRPRCSCRGDSSPCGDPTACRRVGGAHGGRARFAGQDRG